MEFPQNLRAETSPESEGIAGEIVTRRLDQLSPHPSYTRCGLATPASQLSRLLALGNRVWEPIAITQNGWIIDGYARVELARLQGRLMLECIEYELSDAEALHWLLKLHRRSNGLNDFS